MDNMSGKKSLDHCFPRNLVYGDKRQDSKICLTMRVLYEWSPSHYMVF